MTQGLVVERRAWTAIARRALIGAAIVGPATMLSNGMSQGGRASAAANATQAAGNTPAHSPTQPSDTPRPSIPAPPAGAPASGAAIGRGQTRPTTRMAASMPTSRPSTQPAQKISLNFKDAPLDAVLDHLSEAAGLVIIKEGPVEGRVTVQSKQPVTPEEAVTLLSAVLKANGYSAVRNGRIVRIVPRDKAKKGSIPVHIGADPADIASTDELITQVMPIQNVDAVKLRTDLTPLFSTDADVTANDSSNSIIMTDASANIRRVAEIIAALDKGTASSTALKVIHLKFANAAATAKLITSIFHASGTAGAGNPQQQMQMRMQMQQGGQPQPPGGGPREGRIPGGAIDQALRGGHVDAQADDRTNTLILTAPADTMPIIQDIIKELDSNPVPASELKAFRLQYADAEATSKLVSNLFKSGGDDNGSRYGFYNPFAGMGESADKVKVSVTFDQRTNSVLVSAPAEAIKSIAAVIKDLSLI